MKLKGAKFKLEDNIYFLWFSLRRYQLHNYIPVTSNGRIKYAREKIRKEPVMA